MIQSTLKHHLKGVPSKALIVVITFLLSGCAGNESPSGYRNTSPTAALMRGEIDREEYLAAVRKANEEAREGEQFEVDKEPTRSYNTRTQRVEYVPEGTEQSWNPATKRWEFTPVR